MKVQSVAVESRTYWRYQDCGITSKDNSRYGVEFAPTRQAVCVVDSNAGEEEHPKPLGTQKILCVFQMLDNKLFTLLDGFCLDLILTVFWFFPLGTRSI